MFLTKGGQQAAAQHWHEVWDQRIGRDAADLSIRRAALARWLGIFAFFVVFAAAVLVRVITLGPLFYALLVILFIPFLLGCARHWRMGAQAAAAASAYRGEPMARGVMPMALNAAQTKRFDQKYPPRSDAPNKS